MQPKTRKAIAKYIVLPLALTFAAALAAAPAAWVLVLTYNDGTRVSTWQFDDHRECLANAAILRKDPTIKSAHCAPLR
jgi:hypothetical protein